MPCCIYDINSINNKYIIYIYIHIYIYNIDINSIYNKYIMITIYTACVAQWLRRQTHKQ